MLEALRALLFQSRTGSTSHLDIGDFNPTDDIECGFNPERAPQAI